MTEKNVFTTDDVVSSYSAQQAAEDGVIVPVSKKDAVTRAVWEFLVKHAPRTSQPPNCWQVPMMQWFTAEKCSKEEALTLLGKHGLDAQRKLQEQIADKKALALAQGLIHQFESTAHRVWDTNVDGGILKLWVTLGVGKIGEPGTIGKGGLRELHTTDPGEISGKSVLWLIPNEETGGMTLMFPEDY